MIIKIKIQLYAYNCTGSDTGIVPSTIVHTICTGAGAGVFWLPGTGTFTVYRYQDTIVPGMKMHTGTTAEIYNFVPVPVMELQLVPRVCIPQLYAYREPAL